MPLVRVLAAMYEALSSAERPPLSGRSRECEEAVPCRGRREASLRAVVLGSLSLVFFVILCLELAARASAQTSRTRSTFLGQRGAEAAQLFGFGDGLQVDLSHLQLPLEIGSVLAQGNLTLQSAISDASAINPFSGNATFPVALPAGMPDPSSLNPFPSNFTLSVDSSNFDAASVFRENFTIPVSLPGVDVANLLQGNFTLPDGSTLIRNITLPIDIPGGNFTLPAQITNPFDGQHLDQTISHIVESTVQNTQHALQQAAEATKNEHPDFVPTYITTQHEYTKSDAAIPGSWHWPSCDGDHLYKCNPKANSWHLPDGFSEGIHACCCHSGFVWVAESASPIAKEASTGAAIGAANGAVVTGMMGGADLGASTAHGAAAGAVGGMLAGAVQYIAEGGQCKNKDDLTSAVRAHLSLS